MSESESSETGEVRTPPSEGDEAGDVSTNSSTDTTPTTTSSDACNVTKGGGGGGDDGSSREMDPRLESILSKTDGLTEEEERTLRSLGWDWLLSADTQKALSAGLASGACLTVWGSVRDHALAYASRIEGAGKVPSGASKDRMDEAKRASSSAAAMKNTITRRDVAKALRKRLLPAGKWEEHSPWIDEFINLDDGSPKRVPRGGRLFDSSKFRDSDAVRETRDIQPHMETKLERWTTDSPDAHKWQGSHANAVLGVAELDKQPDILAVHPEEDAPSGRNIVAIFELKREMALSSGRLSDDTLGQVIDYAVLVFKEQPYRRHIVVIVATELRVWFLRMHFEDHGGDHRVSRFEMSKAYPFNSAGGKRTATGTWLLFRLVGMPWNSLIWGRFEPRIGGFTTGRCLGSGAEGHVVEITRDADGTRFAAKLFEGDGANERAEREEGNLRRLAATVDRDTARIPILEEVKLETDPGTDRRILVTGPVGEDITSYFITTVTVISMGMVSDLCQGLLQIHEAGLVHRDLRPSNIIVVGTHMRIIDLGMACPPGKAQIPEGTISYAPPEVVEAFLNRDDHVPSFSDDWQSLVRCVFRLYTFKPVPSWRAYGRISVDSCEELAAFWAESLTGPWKDADDAARAGDHTSMLEHLEEACK